MEQTEEGKAKTTTDLVTRLRADELPGDSQNKREARMELGKILDEAAYRIEELEIEVEDWKKRCLSMFVEMVSLLGDTAAEKSNIKAIFENPEELITGEGND